MKKRNFLIICVMLLIGVLIFNACNKDDTTKPVITPVITLDTTKPVITLKGSSTMTIVLNSTFTDPGYTATDDEDGDITSSVVVTGTVDVNTAGTYKLYYTVSDAAGNIGTAERTVIVKNEADYLNGNYNVTDVAAGNTYTYTDNITASSTVNNRVWVTKFAFYTNGAVYFTISGNNVTIPNQTVNCGNPAADRLFSGTGVINGNTINITYTETTGGSTISGTETYVKQ